ncbi:uncharacterized protein LOC109606905 [Aethina tumida]|uniref:uncharacterized protein LOC109606905 n=1 Tax=Aethina tumida TaxID=116153 RepID=UPI0021484370|nr:uncharacterized protein LOC109606905 [Aethina tumida]
MELEKEKEIPFLDVLIERMGEHLDHTVYRKPTHTDRYQRKLSNHHPSQKQGVIKTLTERAKRICAPDHLAEEQEHLEETLQANGYKCSEIRRTMRPHTNNKDPPSEPIIGRFNTVSDLPKIGETIKQLLGYTASHALEVKYTSVPQNVQ